MTLISVLGRMLSWAICHAFGGITKAQGRVVKSEFPTIDAAEDQGTNVRQADKREALF